MKKYISILCCMVLFLHPVSGQRAKLELVKMPIALPAADEAYGKDKRFSRVIPAAIEELAKRTDDPAGGFFANLRMTCPIAAKAVNEKKGETPDIVFEVESPGIQNFRLSPGYFAEYATNTGGMTSVTTKGYLADATFNFPMKVLVKDGQGNLKRTIIVADETEESRMVYHSAFFRKQETGDPSLVFPATGFPTLRDLHVSIERNGKNIAMRCAKNRLEMLFKACSQAIGICYGDAYLSRKGYYFYLKKMDGWNDPAGESLAAAVDRQKEAMAQPYGADSQERLSQSLQSPINTYERYLEQYGKELKPVRELCLNNLVEACYFSGDFEKAALYYSIYYSEFGSLYFDAYFDAVYSYDRLKKSTTTYFALDFSGKIERAADEERRLAKLALERQQAADEAAAAADRQERLEALRREVVIRGEGTVTDADGGKHEGTVAFRLASVQSGILDLDAGRTVMLYNAQTDEYIRSFGLKDMTQVEVNNTVYSPVKKASHFVPSSSILKMIYEKGKYRLYYDPGYGRYYIKSAGGDRAYPVTDILKANGLTEEFYLPCPDMKGKLGQEGAAGDLLPDELKKLIDRIEQMCP